MYYKNLSLFIFLLVLLFPCAQANNSTQHSVSDKDIENAILVHINQYRTRHGLNKLVMDERITAQARRHSIDMATHRMPFGHTDFMKRINSLHSNIKNSGAGAENVAYNYKSADDVVKNWLRSPGHKRNIDGHYNLTGIGIARDARGKIYFTQLFLSSGKNEPRRLAKMPWFRRA